MTADAAQASTPRVFLSYCRSDQADAARLASALADVGFDVWWDHLIEGGAAFAKRIESALEGADAVIVLWSAHAIQSDWVLDEAARGRELCKLVPASLDGTQAPLGFRQYQAVDLTHWRHGDDASAVEALRRAVAALNGATADGSTTRVSAAPRAVSTARRRTDITRRHLILSGLVAVPLLGVGVYTWQRLGGRIDTIAGNSLAVLPFDNLSGDTAQVYFSDGLAEEVRSTLARNLALQVMAKSSSSRFSGRDQDATDIAEELGVAYLLDGSVRRSGDQIRVSADLIDGRTGFSRWSKVFDRRVTDVFEVQTEIALAVAEALSAFIGGASTPRASLVAVGGTENPAAFDAYLRGRALYDLSADETSERAALTQFDNAVEIDPVFAAAHAARARSLTTLANQYGRAEDLATLYGQAIAAAERAIALAPELAEAHSTLGFTLFQGRLDARAARAPFERSIELGAGEATVLARYALYAARCGRHVPAQQTLDRALVRDPLNPLIHRAAGAIGYAARRFDASLVPLRKALSMNPKLSRAHASIGDALLNLGDIEGALAAYAQEPVAEMRLTGFAIAQRRARRAKDAVAATAALDALGDRVLYQQAQVRAQSGDRDVAFVYLARARALGDSGLIYARNDPFLDPLRGDARFATLLDGLGFDPPSPS